MVVSEDDPAYAIEQYLVTAEGEGLRIVRVLETHTHADHVSGHGRFALEHGVPVSVHPLAEAEFPHDAIEDCDEVRVGQVVIRVLHTPGHRPEHCAFVVDDRMVLSGDSLFIGDAARPDLAVDATEGAEGLFSSLQALTRLPDDYELYPGHVAGSLCGVAMSPAHASCLAMLAPIMTMDSGARIYAPENVLLQAGDTLRQPGIEKALSLLVAEGAASMYSGSLARSLWNSPDAGW